jgi:hypothetical protein
LQIKTKIVSCHTADSKPVKQEVNGTVILTPSVFPDLCIMPTISRRVAQGAKATTLAAVAGVLADDNATN